MKKLIFKKKTIIWILGLVGVVLLCFALFKAYLLINPYAYINFALFKPSHEKIEKQQLVLHGYQPSIFDGMFDDELSIKRVIYVEYALEGKEIYVDQRKYDGSNNDCSGLSHDACKEIRSPQGQTYTLLHDVEFRTQAKLIKAGTFISIIDITGQSKNDEEWSRLVDSFQPAEFSDLPYKYVQFWDLKP